MKTKKRKLLTLQDLKEFVFYTNIKLLPPILSVELLQKAKIRICNYCELTLRILLK